MDLGLRDVLDVIRWLYAVSAVFLAILLLWRASRYRTRTRESAYLHLTCALLLCAASTTALYNVGTGPNLMMPMNILGIIGGYLFVIKNPMERVITWKERRGDEPDWDHLIGRAGRRPPGSSSG